MELKCSCNNDCIISLKNIEENLKRNKPCDSCIHIILKRFKPLSDQLCLNTLNNDFGRCICGNRPVDIVLAHTLKIMIDNEIAIKSHTLKNGAIPLFSLLQSDKYTHIGKNSLVILHPNLDKKTAEKIINEVSEVKGVLKGDPNDLIGILEEGSNLNNYELLAGCDFRADILSTPTGKIAINKQQHQLHLEFSASMENKVLKLNNYFKGEHFNNEELSKMKLLDATCGCGSLGLFSLKYGFSHVTFNDINPIACEMTAMNLQSNGFQTTLIDSKEDEFNTIAYGDNFEIYNLSLEKLTEKLIAIESNTKKEFDYCIIDSFPQVDDEYFKKIAEKIAEKIIVI
ncbi:SAM-dependent methyltransferase [Methanobrevibacter filiformis]|uniref:Ribosomal protein L11 methyltransferase n=1 Tax=Methanobrevibacter filiformis TaxID=55758 RepID=A0A162FHL8_9EURY|nr:methyltransferase [Methanobrevibacter filiformis]KZX10070.1 ribosomal protein L11 methyltransferase [Methanobrevibacter filiformis]